jgi:hypothetical protein
VKINSYGILSTFNFNLRRGCRRAVSEQDCPDEIKRYLYW